MRLEDTLKGGYRGLFGEVVTCDMYHLRQVKFQPDLVIDIGANIGVFTRFARELFPAAKIVAVEPDPDNIRVFKEFTHDANTVLLECAMGKGVVYHGLNACNGSGETYLSPGLGYTKEGLDSRGDVLASTVPTRTFQDIVKAYWKPGMKTVVKIDCEGAENLLWLDIEAMSLLHQMDYLTIELHYYSLTGAEQEEVKAVTNAALKSLEETHNCELEHVYFWATKRT